MAIEYLMVKDIPEQDAIIEIWIMLQEKLLWRKRTSGGSDH